MPGGMASRRRSHGRRAPRCLWCGLEGLLATHVFGRGLEGMARPAHVRRSPRSGAREWSMRRMSGTAALLGAILLVAGCTRAEKATTWADNVTAQGADSLGETGRVLGAFWGGPRPVAPEESLTIARVMGAPPSLAPLQPEAGNVWPAVEGPRATLANPDAALRG